jgi:hypothetical protein
MDDHHLGHTKKKKKKKKSLRKEKGKNTIQLIGMNES